jgi:hypothetical protein
MSETFSRDLRMLLGSIAVLLGVSVLPADVLSSVVKTDKHALPAASFTLLEAVSDTFVPATDTPGAVLAGVAEKFDGLLRDWASAQSRQSLIGALEAIDAGAKQAEGKSFAALSPESRKAFLKAHDLAALKPVPRTEKLTGLAAMKALPAVADPDYAKLKELIVSLYYGSEVGLTQELVYEQVPGAWVPSLKITPETRPFASPGLI